MIRLIAAVDRKSGIAKHGYLPWYIPADEKYFSDQTKLYGGNVLTGGLTFRNTYHGRPLTERSNFILSRKKESIQGAEVISDLAQFLNNMKHKDLWIAGGAEVYSQVLKLGLVDELYLTHIDADFNCDQFFPSYAETFSLTKKSPMHEQNGFRYSYFRYSRKI